MSLIFSVWFLTSWFEKQNSVAAGLIKERILINDFGILMSVLKMQGLFFWVRVNGNKKFLEKKSKLKHLWV